MSTGTIDLPAKPLEEALTWCLSLARAPSVRSITDWAEASIILPNGPFSGERYQHRHHPVSRLFFDELDSGRWSRVAATGPTQNGKTLMCYVIPVLYHLFEVGETVIVGLPSMDMANDKWTEDFLPVIESSEYRDLLPVKGEGSRGGAVKRAIKFRNGAVMRFMTAGGNDKKRSAYTSRVVAITEADGMDEAGETSREADKIEQIEARTRAFGRTGKRVYLECTVSIERGRIWQEYNNGTQSKILRPCVHCTEYVAPEREHLVGWKEAESEEEAAEAAHFICPSCGDRWNDADRVDSWSKAVLVHRGQEVSHTGEVTGDLPRTQTFGFRWSAIDNPFVTAGDLGAEEWLAGRSRDRENAEKKQKQFVWTMPYEPPDIEMTPLSAEDIEYRTRHLKKGIVPDDAIAISIGVDTGKRSLHWTATAVLPDGGLHVIEYGVHQVRADELGVQRGLVQALTSLSDYFTRGWHSESGQKRKPSQVWIDSGWYEHTDAVYQFCIKANEALGLNVGSSVFRPTKGYGEGQRIMSRYNAPQKGKDQDVVHVGREFYIGRVRRNGKKVPGILVVHINSDNWKSETHQRLSMPKSDPLAITLYEASSYAEHSELSRHLTAERQMEKFVPGKGSVIVWERVDKNNHWLDATYSAVCAGEAILSLSGEKPKERVPLSEMAKQA